MTKLSNYRADNIFSNLPDFVKSTEKGKFGVRDSIPLVEGLLLIPRNDPISKHIIMGVVSGCGLLTWTIR